MRKTDKEYLEIILPFFPTAFIHDPTHNNELILEPKRNIYFRLDNITSDLEFDCKMIEYLSRSCCKGQPLYWERYFRRGANSYFRKNWTKEDWHEIYGYLGGGCNRKKCIAFIESGWDMKILTSKIGRE